MTGNATPTMFATFVARLTSRTLALTSQFDYLVERASVLPRERRCVDRAEVGGLLLVTRHRRLAGGRDLPLCRVGRALLLRHVVDRCAQRGEENVAAARADLGKPRPAHAAARR